MYSHICVCVHICIFIHTCVRETARVRDRVCSCAITRVHVCACVSVCLCTCAHTHRIAKLESHTLSLPLAQAMSAPQKRQAFSAIYLPLLARGPRDDDVLGNDSPQGTPPALRARTSPLGICTKSLVYKHPTYTHTHTHTHTHAHAHALRSESLALGIYIYMYRALYMNLSTCTQDTHTSKRPSLLHFCIYIRIETFV